MLQRTSQSLHKSLCGSGPDYFSKSSCVNQYAHRVVSEIYGVQNGRYRSTESAHLVQNYKSQPWVIFKDVFRKLWWQFGQMKSMEVTSSCVQLPSVVFYGFDIAVCVNKATFWYEVAKLLYYKLHCCAKCCHVKQTQQQSSTLIIISEIILQCLQLQ